MFFDKLFVVHKNVMSGQCKSALLRLQIRYTAIFFFPGLIKGWAGSRIGLFAPKKYPHGYECKGFYFHPWLAPDVAVCNLPSLYRKIVNAISFSF